MLYLVRLLHLFLGLIPPFTVTSFSCWWYILLRGAVDDAPYKNILFQFSEVSQKHHLYGIICLYFMQYIFKEIFLISSNLFVIPVGVDAHIDL